MQRAIAVLKANGASYCKSLVAEAYVVARSGNSYCDIGDGLDTLVVAGGCTCVEEACKDPSLVTR
jgi:hypothetical protein